jgi:hypothetical protein
MLADHLEESSFGRPRCRWEDIKMDLTKSNRQNAFVSAALGRVPMAGFCRNVFGTSHSTKAWDILAS